MFKKFNLIALSIFACAMIVTSASAEEDKDWSVDTSAAFFNAYMFRGQRLYDGNSFQPSVTGNYKSEIGTFSGNLWMHLSASNDNDPERFTELDETLKWSKQFGDFAVSAGHVWYTYPHKSDHIASTKEFFVSGTYDSYLLPTLSYYRDWDQFESNYFELAMSHSYAELAENSEASLSPFVALGFASNAEKLYADNGLEHVTVGTSLAFPIGEVSVVPSVNYTFEVDDTTQNQLWFGSSVNYSF